MAFFGSFLSNTSNFLYTYILIALLIFAGLYFTIRTRGVQFRLFLRPSGCWGRRRRTARTSLLSRP